MPASYQLGELHSTLNAAMGWLDIGCAAARRERRPRRADARRRQALRVLWYDFGDSWHHGVVIEKTGSAEEGVFYPRCIAGRRACPPEDCGGLWGFAEFEEAMADPRHIEHEELKEWHRAPCPADRS